MAKEICMIDIGKGQLDDEYTIYEDGKIKHLYDQSIYKHDVVEWLTKSDIEESIKLRLLEKCPKEKKEQVKSILY